MIKLKRIQLKDYCGYRDAEFDFTSSGKLKSLVCFFGENGSGKSMLLGAINILSSAHRFYGRNNELFFRKFTYSPDYDPIKTNYEIEYANNSVWATENFKDKIAESTNHMEMVGIFDTDDGDKKVVITEKGIQENELPKDRLSYGYFIDGDHPMNTQMFQLHTDMDELFVDMAKDIFGLECYLDKKVNDLDGTGDTFYTDFVIIKHDGTKVHYKNMSAGERKIATVLRSLCNPIYIKDLYILMIDNICMHVYKDRHAVMVNKLITSFPDKQFFITTHSPILVGVNDPVYGIDIKPYLPEESLYPIESIKVKK